MLIVLLDCSRSMNEPFGRGASNDDHGGAAAYTRKSEAARQVLRESLEGAQPAEPVVVLGFAGEVMDLARGSAIDGADLQSRIDAVKLGSGTDIPAALAAAVSALRCDAAAGPRKVILITDGLLDGRPDEDLDPVIQELAHLGGSIEVILIGGSYRGLKVALRVAGHESPRIVTSTGERFPPLVPGGLAGGPVLVGSASGGVPLVPAAAAAAKLVGARLPPAGTAPDEPDLVDFSDLAGEPADWDERDARRSADEPPGARTAPGGFPAAAAAGLRDVEREREYVPVLDEPADCAAAIDSDAFDDRDERERGVSTSEGPKWLDLEWGGAPPPPAVDSSPGTPAIIACEILLRPARDAEDVAVTVVHAPSVTRGTWHSLDVFVHLASLEDEVNRIVRAERGNGAARASRGTRLPRGTVVRIEPRIERAELDIESLELRWREDIQRMVFRFRSAAGATELRGSVDLYVEHALICSVPIVVTVVDGPIDAAPTHLATGWMMDVVFVSYATEERPIVERVTRTYRELGIAVLMDKDFLRTGDATGEVLHTQIERADVFQLFWSRRSSRKPWVEREWRHALTLAGPAGRKGARFIRPLVWERSPPPWPPELAALQFGRLELPWFARATARLDLVTAMCFATIALAIVLVVVLGSASG